MILIAVEALGADEQTLFVPLKTVLSSPAPTVTLVGAVEPTQTAVLTSGWMALLDQVKKSRGDYVKKGELIASVDGGYVLASLTFMQRLRSLGEVRFERARSALGIVEQAYARSEALVAKGIMQPRVLEDIQLQVLAATGDVTSERENIANLDKEIAELKARLDSVNYYAPIDGVISDLLVSPDELVGKYMVQYGATLARIDRPGFYTIKCLALDTQVRQLTTGQRGQITLGSSAVPVPGAVKSIKPVINKSDPRPFYEVAVDFEFPGPLLKTGTLASVEIARPVGQKPAIFVPRSAVKRVGAKTWVMALRDDGTWIKRPVKLGRRTRHQIEVQSGLAEGELIQAELW